MKEIENFVEEHLSNVDCNSSNCYQSWDAIINGIDYSMVVTVGFKTRKINGVYLWTKNGTLSLYSVKTNYPDVVDIESAKKNIISIIKDYENGLIHCAGCGRAFPISELKNGTKSFYAGVYCQECWDAKWASIAADEIYD